MPKRETAVDVAGRFQREMRGHKMPTQAEHAFVEMTVALAELDTRRRRTADLLAEAERHRSLTVYEIRTLLGIED